MTSLRWLGITALSTALASLAILLFASGAHEHARCAVHLVGRREPKLLDRRLNVRRRRVLSVGVLVVQHFEVLFMRRPLILPCMRGCRRNRTRVALSVFGRHTSYNGRAPPSPLAGTDWYEPNQVKTLDKYCIFVQQV